MNSFEHRRRLGGLGGSRPRSVLLTCGVLANLQPLASLAQETPAMGLEEVVVTAERRSAAAQEVPISITGISDEQLSQRGIVKIEDLVSASPALTVQDNGLIKLVNIRGIGLQVVQPTTSSGVAYHIDGMFIPKEISLGAPYYDLARVEVLRGPQGTLAGQNATGGAVFVVSQKPELAENTSGHVELRAANYSTFEANGAVNLPISSQVAGRIAATFESHDSFTQNVASNVGIGGAYGQPASQPGSGTSYAVRPQLLWKPTDTTEVLLRYERVEQATDNSAQKMQDDPNPDPWEISYNTPTKFDSRVDRFNVEVNWDMTDAVRLRSLTSYQYQKLDILLDLDRSSAVDYAQNQIVWDRVWEQEVNLISTGDSKLQWVLGAFYMQDKTPVNLDIGYHAGDPSTGFFPFGALKVVINPTHKAAAVFGQVTYALTDALEAIVGARYNHDDKESDGFLAVAPTQAAFTDSKPTGKLALNWKLSDSTNGYVSASRGYKAGGIDANGHVSEAETVNAYELGLKSEWLARRLRLNGAVFKYDYNDFQLPVFDPTLQQSNTANVPKSEIKGAEVTLEAAFNPVMFDVSVGYLDSEIGPNTALVDPRQGPNPIDVSGQPLNNAPEWTASGGISYEVQLKSGTLTPSARYAYKDRYLLSPFDQPQTDSIPVTSSVDVRLRFESAKHWWTEAYVTNADDRLNVSDIGSGFPGGYYVNYAPPRQYGVRFGMSY